MKHRGDRSQRLSREKPDFAQFSTIYSFNDDVERPVSSRDRANHVLIGPERIRRRPFRQIADLVEFCGKTTIQHHAKLMP